MEQLLTPADLVVVFVLLLFSMLGLMRGFMSEILGIFAWSAGILFILGAFPHTVKVANDLFSNNLIAHTVAGVLLFVITLFVMSYGRKIMTIAVKSSTISPFDQFFGLIFGLVKGLMILSLVYMAILVVAERPEDRPVWIEQARTKPMFDQIAAFALDNIDVLDDFRNGLSKGIVPRLRSGGNDSADGEKEPENKENTAGKEKSLPPEPIEYVDPLLAPLKKENRILVPPKEPTPNPYLETFKEGLTEEERTVDPLFPEEDVDIEFDEVIEDATDQSKQKFKEYLDNRIQPEPAPDPLLTPPSN